MKPKFKVGDWIRWPDFDVMAEITAVNFMDLIYKYKFIKHQDLREIGNTVSYSIEFIDRHLLKAEKPINYNEYWAKLNEI